MLDVTRRPHDRRFPVRNSGPRQECLRLFHQPRAEIGAKGNELGKIVQRLIGRRIG